jgi:hypothetical protein
MRLCRAVTGEEYGEDYERVTGIGIGISEPGYGDADTVWVLGDWNDRTDYSTGERVVTDSRMSRLFDALERIGVECHWLDEWRRCDGCQNIIRSQPDSYHWQPSYVLLADELFCVECATGDYLDETIAEYIGDSSKAIFASLVSASELESRGFVRYNVPPAENGWHPGQDDTPDAIVAAFMSEYGTAEWLFYLDETSQFYIRFTLFYRPASVRCNICGDTAENCPDTRGFYRAWV